MYNFIVDWLGFPLNLSPDMLFIAVSIISVFLLIFVIDIIKWLLYIISGRR